MEYFNNIPKNWRTTLGGALIGIPQIIIGAGYQLTPGWLHFLGLCTGGGALLLGMSAKDSSTHSNVLEVEKSTVTAISKGEVAIPPINVIVEKSGTT